MATSICAICIAMTSMVSKCTVDCKLEAFTVETNQQRGESKMIKLSIIQRENKIDINKKRNHLRTKHYSCPRATEN